MHSYNEHKTGFSCGKRLDELTRYINESRLDVERHDEPIYVNEYDLSTGGRSVDKPQVDS